MPKSKFVQWVERGITEVSTADLGDITSIGMYAFFKCKSLTSANIPNTATIIESGAFKECNNLTSITIPYGITSIGNEAFRDCDSLSSITIPNSVGNIGTYAFYNCNDLKSITIPDRVTGIGEYAFGYCTSLEYVSVLRQTPPTKGTNTFLNTPDDCVIIVPPNASNAYKTAWADMADRICGGWQEYYYTQMNSLADSINTKAGTTGTKTIYELTIAVTDNLVKPVGTQYISTLSSYNVRDKASAQVSPVEGAKIVPSNIKDGVEILGVTGSYRSSSSLNDLIGCNTIYLDPYHITYNGTSQAGHYFYAYDVEDPSDPSVESYNTYEIYWDVYNEELDGDQIQTINGHMVYITYVLRYEHCFHNDDPEPPCEYTSLCYTDNSNCYWETSVVLGVDVVSIDYVDNSYIPLFSNTPISYGNYSKINNLSSSNIKSGVAIGADASVHNAGVLGSYSGEGVDFDLVESEGTPYINTYSTVWNTIFTTVASGTTILTLSGTSQLTHGGELVAAGSFSNNAVQVVSISGTTSVNGYNINYTKILRCEYKEWAVDEGSSLNTAYSTLAYYSSGNIYWNMTSIPVVVCHDASYECGYTITSVSYSNDNYKTLFSRSPLAFGGFLVNTTDSNIKQNVVIGSGTSNSGIKGTLDASSSLNDLVGHTQVYINTYDYEWYNSAYGGMSFTLNTDDSANPIEKIEWEEDWYGDEVYINGYTIIPQKMLVHRWGYVDPQTEDFIEAGSDVLAYHNDVDVFWESNDFVTQGTITSVDIPNAYKTLFANTEIAYGGYVYQDDDLISSNIREDTIVGDHNGNAGIRGSLSASGGTVPSWLYPDIDTDPGWNNIYFNKAVRWDNLLNMAVGAFGGLEAMTFTAFNYAVCLASEVNNNACIVWIDVTTNPITILPIYALNSNTINVEYMGTPFAIQCEAGWNVSSINFPGSRYIIYNMGDWGGILNYLGVTDQYQLWSGIMIAYGDYTSSSNPPTVEGHNLSFHDSTTSTQEHNLTLGISGSVSGNNLSF